MAFNKLAKWWTELVYREEKHRDAVQKDAAGARKNPLVGGRTK